MLHRDLEISTYLSVCKLINYLLIAGLHLDEN